MELFLFGFLAGGMHLSTRSSNTLLGKTVLPYLGRVSVDTEEDIPVSLVAQAIDDVPDSLSILINKEASHDANEEVNDFDYFLALELADMNADLIKERRSKDQGPAKTACSGAYPYFLLQDEDRLVSRAEQRSFDTLGSRGVRSGARLEQAHRRIPVFYGNVRIT
jgi:hypothetical protein